MLPRPFGVAAADARGGGGTDLIPRQVKIERLAKEQIATVSIAARVGVGEGVEDVGWAWATIKHRAPPRAYREEMGDVLNTGERKSSWAIR
jgi:hypothetical protein